MRLNATGLGIGTSTPGAKLQVVGEAIVGGGSSADIFKIRGRTSDNFGLMIFENSGGTDTRGYFGSPADNTFAWYDGGFTERMRLDSSGNLGLGVTPSAWRSNYKALQINTTGAVWSSPQFTFFSDNTYQDSSDVSRYLTTAPAVLYALNRNSGVHAWYNAPSGTAGNTISFTQAMTLTAAGKLGIGVTSPSGLLDVRGAAPFMYIVDSAGANQAAFVAEATNTVVNVGSTYLGTAAVPLAFVTGGTERARITSGGDLLVGTTNTSATAGEGFKSVFPIAAVPSVRSVGNNSTSSYSTYEVYSTSAAAYRFYVDYAGTVFATTTTISAISDQRFKENIQDIDVGLNAVMALKPRKFDWKAGKGKDIKGDRGFIAQEFEQVFPDLIDEWKDPAPEGEEPYKSVRQDLIPVLVKAIQELTARVAQLESK
jgi:hypothetical protein